ncbi:MULTISPECIES: 2-amino-4-hydroxy-6-hydroxymethyldihydropteridine diphosphokinase [Pseudomonas]|uniref:2-amino-4-hydroxy-6-hydroxymethyldihydropteridine pyrophosphokinase n=1 Tax=Pseudomonas haemolytica TaxID=2600065 RepID=A0A5P1DIG2_9PSED|nr:2-amino-4-hydroxy-6-hydroxymethyldihydropteridine diphosphokinase [Pseudomonas haemolytica]MBJ2287742.1 2-amino-4-hydroxy-6-hydroxymethyldihydropteridine diphosphokinase [Pseudomonas sp. MF6755]MBJ2247859.1 2-amino-4-hydroxy-6-hydroxymethyldihydropteridine diphosphokinase [Pseudomonas haemolytica]MBJ2274876.1 2-amino-4-hydroxy-6-hydroxymethyldihydropteridine diphosphokinase [Pseudomonas haemolytica]MBK3449672.1 2-amino-4-hydroxy-6-hydroxymethyldihydropteridine diphosphokinase [Pseudomonas ha
MERIYIGMGSNLAAPQQQLRSAVEALAKLPGTQLAGVSAFYQSDSLLPGQPRYTNAVAALDSDLAPLDLLDALQAIENDQGRERLERWGPRTLDLDILLFGDRLIDEPRLKVPHYQMHVRAFVLYPLAELAPGTLQLPDGRRLSDLLTACPFVGLERLPL